MAYSSRTVDNALACRYELCVSEYNACTRARASDSAGRRETILGNNDLNPGECTPLLAINRYARNLEQACYMTTIISLKGMAVWRWLLFMGLFWPLELVAYTFARFIAFLVHTNLLGKHVRRLCDFAGDACAASSLYCWL